jgi:hypothetical protein
MISKRVSALTLLVAGVLADDAHHIVAADDLAGFAKTFDGSSDFHARVTGVFAPAGVGVRCCVRMVTAGVAG